MGKTNIGLITIIFLCLSGSGMADNGRNPGKDACASPNYCGNQICEYFVGETLGTCADCQEDPVIIGATITMSPMEPIQPSHGDLWFSTWAEDDELYTVWGDGCGPGFEYDPLLYTDLGIARLTGAVPNLTCEPLPNGCVRARSIPSGFQDHDDKPSSILAIDGRLYLAGHTPLGEPDEGYIAYSDDWGSTWTKVPDSPWVKDAADRRKSPFRCMMFINMGQNYELNSDGYVYALGIGWEWDWDVADDSNVYLTRVPVSSILDYSSYVYYTGDVLKTGQRVPTWSADQDLAVPVPGLISQDLGSAMYHEGTGRYIYLMDMGLFEAPNPWGPWTMTASLLAWGDNPEWVGGYMPGLITKGAGPDSVWFTFAGQTSIIGYRLQLGRIDFTTRKQSPELSVSIESTGNGNNDASADTTQNKIKLRRSGHSSRSSIRVPQDYPTIQEAVDASVSGDTILIADGTYTGTDNRNIFIQGIGLTVKSENGPESCVMDCEFSGRGFMIHDTTGMPVQIHGLTVQNAYSKGSGGAFSLLFSTVVIQNCIIRCCGVFSQAAAVLCYESGVEISDTTMMGNSAGTLGGAISALAGTSLLIQSCKIEENEGTVGGGIHCESVSHLEVVGSSFRANNAQTGAGIAATMNCRTTIYNCWFEDNVAELKGGGVFYDMFYLPSPCPESMFKMTNCTFIGNSSDNFGGGFFADRSNSTVPEISNCIFWENTAPMGPAMAFNGTELFTALLSYSDIQGGQSSIYTEGGWVAAWGNGMIDSDPFFKTGPSGEFYLSHFSTGQPSTSPCVDAGSALAENICFNSEINNRAFCLNGLTTRSNEEPDNNRADMGAHYQVINPVPSLSLPVLLLCLVLMGTYLISKYRQKDREAK